MDYVAIGKRIRRLRQQHNITQEQLSERAYISASFLGHIERGSRIASLETMVNLARSLDTSLDPLMKECFDMTPTPNINVPKEQAVQVATRLLMDFIGVAE